MRELPPYVPKHPERAIPKSTTKYVRLEIDGHVYSGLTREEAESIKRGNANGTFSGWGKTLRLPSGEIKIIPTEFLHGSMRGASVSAEEGYRRMLAAEAAATPVATPESPTRPPDGPRDPNPSKEDPHSKS